MSTVGDVFDADRKVRAVVELLGSSAGFGLEYALRMEEVRRAVMAERGLTEKQMRFMGRDNELLYRSQALFDNLRRWVNEQPGGRINGRRVLEF